MQVGKRSATPRRRGKLPTRSTQATTALDADQVCAEMLPWPRTWRFDDPDIPYGEGLVREFTPFVVHLVQQEHLSRSTVRRHLNHLFLLGGELISRINIYEEDRRLSPRRLLDRSLDPEGGPLCRHAQQNGEQRAFDATCKKLYAFRSTESRAHRFR